MTKRFLFWLVLYFQALPVMAQTVTPDKYWYSNYQSGVSNFDIDIVKLCKRGLAFQDSKNGTTTTYTGYVPQAAGSVDMWCQGTRPPATTPSSYVGAYPRQCTTATPYWDANTNTCTATYTAPPPTCTKGAASTVRWNGDPALSSYRFPTSYAGCEITIDEVLECYSAVNAAGATVYYCDFRVLNTGNPASPGAVQGEAPGAVPGTNPEREPSPPLPGRAGGGCPKGTVQGGMGADGVPQCIGTGTVPENAPPAPPKTTTSQATTNADGSTTTTTTTTTTNRDGSTTTVVDSVTVGSGGTTATQTSETSNTPTGAPGQSTPAPDKEQANFCKQNPTLAVCRESSVSGTCGTIACVGDAVQCATLRAAAMMQCKQAEDEAALKASGSKTLGDSILAGLDPKQGAIDGALKGTEVDIGKEKLDQGGFLGSGSCIAPKTFSFFGTTVEMDFATACESAEPARYVILALGFLAAYLIVSRSVLNT